MKLKLMLLNLVIFSIFNTCMATRIYYLDGLGQEVGDIRIQNSRPVSSLGRTFSEFTRMNSQPYTGRSLVLIKDAITGVVDLPNWDFTCAGNVTCQGAVTCNNMNIGFQGSISN